MSKNKKHSTKNSGAKRAKATKKRAEKTKIDPDAVYLADLVGTVYWISGKLRSMVTLDSSDSKINDLNHDAQLALLSAERDLPDGDLRAPTAQETFRKFHYLLPKTNRPAAYRMSHGYMQIRLGDEEVDLFPIHPDLLLAKENGESISDVIRRLDEEQNDD